MKSMGTFGKYVSYNVSSKKIELFTSDDTTLYSIFNKQSLILLVLDYGTLYSSIQTKVNSRMFSCSLKDLSVC